MVGFELQRKNMVESQVRTSDITDRRILRAMTDVPRELFVPAAVRATVYSDIAVPLDPSQPPARRRYLLPARTTAMLIQQLELGDAASVLEIGAGTGYTAALLSRIAQRVVAVESDAALAGEAKARLADLKVGNVKVVAGSLGAGDAEDGPYDAILISGALPTVPASLLDQLKDGGRLSVVSVEGGVSRLVQWRRLGGAFDRRTVADAAAPQLPGFEQAATFVF